MKHLSSRLSLAPFALTLILARGALAQTETVLYSFTGGNDGSFPAGQMIVDSNGNLYGAIPSGGTNQGGVVFELALNVNGTYTEKTVYAFGNSAPTEGTSPAGALVMDGQGNLYGTTGGGGTYYAGAVFELTPAANGTWTETILYSFQAGTDARPSGGLVMDKAGNLYGIGGGGTYGAGTAYELVAGKNGTYTESVLHSFKTGFGGSNPYSSSPVLDSEGNVYGVTSNGGRYDYGAVFKLHRGAKGGWTERVLYSFTLSDAVGGPIGTLVTGSDGALYGVASYAVYKLTPSFSGTWTLQILHRFAGGTDGAYGYSLTSDKTGNLYGTTYTGGARRGTVFKLTPNSDGSWTEKVLHSFSPTRVDGKFPRWNDLVVDTHGAVFGTTTEGGANDQGVVFKVAP